MLAWFLEMLDLTPPGATSMTLTPNGLSSMESPSVILCNAALAAQYSAFQGVVLGAG